MLAILCWHPRLALCGVWTVITFMGPRVLAAGAVMAPATHTQYSHSHDRQSACSSIVTMFILLVFMLVLM